MCPLSLVPRFPRFPLFFELLKRSDESYVVENAHKNPKFVEDYVRTMAKNIVTKFSHLSDDAVIMIKQIN